MPTQTSNYKLTKDSSNDFYNINTFNSNFDKIDEGMNSNRSKIATKSDKTHNHNGVYEPVISKKTGFNLNKSDSLTNDSTNTLATSKAVKTMNDKSTQKFSSIDAQLDETATVDFETNGATVASFPSGGKGLFNPVLEGREPTVNLIRNGNFKCNTKDWKPFYSKLESEGEICKVTGTGSSKGAILKQAISEIKAGDKIFLYAKLKVLNNKADRIYVEAYEGHDYLGNSSITHFPNNNQYYEKYKICTSKKGGLLGFQVTTTYPDANSAKGKQSIIDGRAGLFAINMTDSGIENYTEEQMLEIVHRGYWEGMKISPRSYEIESRGENKYKDTLNWSKGKYVNGVIPDSTTATEMIISPNRYCFKGSSWTGICCLDYVYIEKGELHIEAECIQGHLGGFRVVLYDYKLDVVADLGYKHFNNAVYQIPQDGLIRFSVEKQDDEQCVISDIMVTTTSITKYVPYASSKMEFSVPLDYPMLEGAYIDACGKYNVKWNKSIVDGHRVTRLGCIYGDMREVVIQNAKLVDLDFTRGESNICCLKDGNIMPFIRNSTECIAIYTDSNGLYIYLPSSIGSTVVAYKNYLKDNNIIMYNKRSGCLCLKDGDEGYKAPTGIKVFNDGDCIVKGTHVKRYKLDNTNTIILTEVVQEIDTVKGEVDGQNQELEYTLTNATTVTLKQPYTGYVYVKGHLPASSYINPNIKGKIPLSLGLMAHNTAEEAAKHKLHSADIQERNDLLLSNHRLDIDNLKNNLKRIYKTDRDLTLHTNNWNDKRDSIGYYEYKITDVEVSDSTVVNINIHLNDMQTAIDAEVQSVTQSSNGYYRLFSRTKPTKNITIDIVKERGQL